VASQPSDIGAPAALGAQRSAAAIIMGWSTASAATDELQHDELLRAPRAGPCPSALHAVSDGKH
jgi:hypothetical protein